ncbi:PDR/VanB family oxidoreductase [Actibacterium sp.]|jgi:ferredoxin-NADP reductase|uniref:PDR/VanB family oxidoreductase n=1 Tax=Actibacterium sp. TaxID=1872125 RepID=UPI000AB68B82|nr:PDR/VanB family oxidoreductase [Actibacterium sp.]|tara:strand:- start:4072 stop:5028 length:957 start_codon:yes stop_codon:yes gene_type:complete
MMQDETPKRTLKVAARHREADDVVGLVLVDPEGADLPAWSPGAHIDLALGESLVRQYSLCGDPEVRQEWRVAVLREPESRGGSKWIHSDLKVGQLIEAQGPRNNFGLEPAREYLFVAGGIGVTPLLPMIQELARKGADWRLLYGGRKQASMAFTDALGEYGERVQIRPEDQFGLLDLKAFLGSPREGVGIYTCGPERLLEAIEMETANWPEGTLHMERFKPKPGALEGASGSFEVILAKTGGSVTVGPDETIIDALDRIGLHVPRSCGEGTCGTCLTKVLDGTPDHRDSFLMGRKRAENKAMCVCCSRALTPTITLKL